MTSMARGAMSAASRWWSVRSSGEFEAALVVELAAKLDIVLDDLVRRQSAVGDDGTGTWRSAEDIICNVPAALQTRANSMYRLSYL